MKTDKALDVHGLTLSQAKNVIKNVIWNVKKKTKKP